MALTKPTIFSLFFIAVFLLSASARPAQAFIYILPDCNKYPQHSFCQWQCYSNPTLPWCSQPTPIPAPEPEPVIIVPGTLASLNVEVTLTDNEGGSWDFAPFTRAMYRGLIERLEAAGFTENQDLFIAHYDWRHSNNESAAEFLKPVIDQAKQTSGADKVDLVAHSMGGLVARAYIQGPNYENDVDQFITLGTPHLGAADAYVAWEGGELPERWGPWTKLYVSMVEDSLQIAHLSPLPRPNSFRTFFPFLRDLLPTSDFANVDGSPVATGDLTEQNLFLQQLNSTLDGLTNAVDVKTIAGTDLNTLNSVNLSSDRSILDQLLNRWRDGHANPDPPPADTTAGDKTITLASAHIGNNHLTLNNVEHDKLPEAAQEQVLQTLGLEPIGPMLTYDLPDSVLGTVVLSPVDPVITGPNGEVLSQNENTFPDAEYVDDPADPNGPKLLVIANPPEGDYNVTLAGTASGDYTVITTYADADETVSTTSEGATAPGQQDTTSFTLTNETFVADIDLVALTKELQQTIRDLFKAKHIKPRAFGALYASATGLHVNAQIHQRLAEKFGDDHKLTQRALDRLQRAFDRFSHLLDEQIERELLDEVSAPQLLSLRDQIQAGL